MSQLLARDDPWIEILRHGPPRDHGRCVLLWVQHAKRATMNRAANVAVAIADHLDLPVVALFVLVPDYPAATLRSYKFMAEGLQELPEAFTKRGVGWTLRIGSPVDIVTDTAAELAAAVLVTDQDPLRTGRGWRVQVAQRVKIPFLAVDSDTVAPPALFPKEEYAARTMRPKLWRAIVAGDYLAPLSDTTPRTKNALSVLRDGPDPVAALDNLALDRSVMPSRRFRGGRADALRRLERFLETRLATYPENHNRPETETQSGLSPYLHFGQISPLEIATMAIAARAGDRAWLAPKGATQIGLGEPRDDTPLADFLDELITQRELAVNFCLRNRDYDRWHGLPEWGRTTLRKHRGVPRPVIYPRAVIDAGETGDRLWNAAQRQMRHEGWMPNRLRMYWAKQLLLWTDDPEEAFHLAVALNDRYFVDGRDANGYANIAWTIGGRHDRPFAEREILGMIRPMGAKGMARTMDVESYIALVESRTGETVPPLPAAAARQRPLALASSPAAPKTENVVNP
ncbi:MAG: deoxyribodipyrimidine photo-lyase [Chloroflexia bacterium]|nr:deoxyribodipyrimidine photo-lyase [Chloroflexia bacterium]